MLNFWSRAPKPTDSTYMAPAPPQEGIQDAIIVSASAKRLANGQSYISIHCLVSTGHAVWVNLYQATRIEWEPKLLKLVPLAWSQHDTDAVRIARKINAYQGKLQLNIIHHSWGGTLSAEGFLV